MTDPLIERRREAIDTARANNALSGFEPSAFACLVFERWISGDCTVQQAVEEVKEYYRAGALADEDSDMHAQQNLLGLTDSRQLHRYEADVTTLRMAELLIGPI